MDELTSPFEMSREVGTSEQSKKVTKNVVIHSDEDKDIFNELIIQGENLDNDVDNLMSSIEDLKIENKEEFSKNFTFSIIFKSLNLMFNEYKAQSELFNTYSKTYFTILSEEGLVSLLNIMREILKERRTIVHDVINNIIKIQKLTNDRIKIDLGTGANDGAEDIVNPDEII